MKTIQIKDICSVNPKSNIKVLNFINYIDTSSVIDGSIINIQCIHKPYPSRAQRAIINQDILISSVRPILKHNYFVQLNLENLVASSGFIHIRVTNKFFLPKFVYYFLTSEKNIRNFDLIANFNQTTYPTLNKETIQNLFIPNLSLNEQQHIVNTISTLVLKSL